MQKITLTGKTVLVTGAAGFIGNNLVLELLRTVEAIQIVGIVSFTTFPPPAFVFLQYTVLQGVRIWLTSVSPIS